MKKLFLLDAYALIFRAYYALIKMPRITQSGFNTSAIFGFVNTLEELLRKENPTHIAVCFDPPGPTFRNEAYDKYKAERAATPEDIKLSVPIIKDIVRAYNIPVVEVEGFEADDVIGTLAKMAAKQDFTTYMMTPDKDYAQLVETEILQYKPSYRGQDFEIRGPQEVCEKYGLQRPLQMIDYLALMGDKSDNIPGCPGVGEKTAKILIEQYDNVDNLIANSHSLKGALRKKVEENAELIKFSKFLATIRTDVPLSLTPEDFARKDPGKEKLFAIFRQLEFNTLLNRVQRRLDAAITPSQTQPQKSNASPFSSLFSDSDFDNNDSSISTKEEATPHIELQSLTPEIVNNADKYREMNDALLAAPCCGMRISASGENDMGAEITGIAIALPEKCYFIPINNKEAIALALDTLTRRDITKLCVDAKRDYVLASRLRADKADPLVNFRDLSLAHYLLQPDMRHTPDAIAPLYIGTSLTADPKKNPLLHACEEAMVALNVTDTIEKEVEKAGMASLLFDIELPLVRVLADMEIAGVRIDKAALAHAQASMEKRLETIENDIYQLAGCKFNVGSPAKVGEILFDHLQLDTKAKKTKTGQYSTSEEVLEKLAPKHPIINLILKYRQLRKLISTYLAALPAAINPATGKVHTNYNQAVTATGRLSSSSPNLQNIPVRDEEGKLIREAFIADENSLFLSADYSQIELRLLADFSNDEIMLEAFREGKDIHAITAAKIYHKPQEEVTADERRHAKTANFGIVYGISAFGLANRLNIPRSDAKEIIDNYFHTFPTVQHYMSQSVESARENGYVQTKLGRRRPLPDINSRNPVVRGYAERNAINAPIQGTAADVIKVAMIRIYDEIKRRGLRSQMIMQVHDELNFNVPENEIGEMQELVSRLMQEAYTGNVTLTASCGAASNWLDAH